MTEALKNPAAVALGSLPKRRTALECIECGTGYEAVKGIYCGATCRKRAYRRRHAGKQQNAKPQWEMAE